MPPGLAARFREVVRQVRANEPRTLHYLSLREPGSEAVTVVETYADVNALADHLARPYIKDFIARMDAARVEPKIRVLTDTN